MTEALLPYDGPAGHVIKDVAWREIAGVLDGTRRVDEAVLALREAVESAGYDSGEEAGTINDFSSVWRLQLMVECCLSHENGFHRWKTGFLEGCYEAFPACELFVAEPEHVDADYWRERWMAKGGRIYDGRMIAMKADVVWQRASVFGAPWEPTDCTQALGHRDLSRKETMQLGVTWSDVMTVRPVREPRLFYFDVLPEWQGEWPALKALVPDLRRR